MNAYFFQKARTLMCILSKNAKTSKHIKLFSFCLVLGGDNNKISSTAQLHPTQRVTLEKISSQIMPSVTDSEHMKTDTKENNIS